MGYYTYYSMEVLDIDNKGYDSYEIAKYMLDKQKESDKFYAFKYDLENFVKKENIKSRANDELFLDSGDEYKWYDNEEDMRLLSKEFPDILFKLHGKGEDNEDIWDKYFINGKMQHCPAKIVYEPFDKNKLH